MQDEGPDLRFFIGPSIHCRLYEGDRLTQQVHRGPFDSIYAFYDSVLELTERELENHKHQARRAIRSALTSEEDSSSDHLELSDGAGLGTGDRIVAGLETCYQRPYDHQDAALAQADMDDHENWLDWGPGPGALAYASQQLAVYRYALPKLCPCPCPPAAELMSTMLVHPDLSMANMFVTQSGIPVAIIDWERAQLEPATMVTGMPLFLENEFRDLFFDPSADDKRRTGARKVVSAVWLAAKRRRSEEDYTDIAVRLELTKLRAVYREELERLKPPLCKALNRDSNGMEQQLSQRVYWPGAQRDQLALDWVNVHLVEDWLDDSDEEASGDT